jgi:hypothetical protein
MRGEDVQQDELFSYGSLEERVPANHPLRPTRAMVGEVLKDMSNRFDEIYGADGRRSIPPERLLRALLIQMLYTVRSDRMLMEQLEYNLLFRWFVGLRRVSRTRRIWPLIVQQSEWLRISGGQWVSKPSPRRDLLLSNRSNYRLQSSQYLDRHPISVFVLLLLMACSICASRVCRCPDRDP